MKGGLKSMVSILEAFNFIKTRKFDIRNIIFLVIGCAIIVAMIWKIGIEKMSMEFLEVNLYFLVGAFLLSLLSIILKLCRWNNLFRIAKTRDASGVYLIGMAVNQIMPVGFGEVTRAYVAKDRVGIPVGKTLAPVAIERIADVTFLVAMSIGCLTFLTLREGYILQIALTILIISIGYFFLMKNPVASHRVSISIYQPLLREPCGKPQGILKLKPHFIEKLALVFEHSCNPKVQNNFINKLAMRISEVLRTFAEALAQFNTKRDIVYQTVVLTIISWIVYGLFMYVLLLAFGVSVFIPYVLTITAASEIIGTFSFIPGGLGAKDVSFAVLLVPFGVPLEVAMSAFLMGRLMAYLQLGAGAIVSLMSFGRKVYIV